MGYSVIGTGGGGSTTAFEKYANEAAIIAAYPDGSTATSVIINEATDTVWVWDVGGSAWVDSGTDISGKQDTLVSGTNIKTVGGESILGAGDLEVGGGGRWKVLELSLSSAVTYNKSDLEGANFLYLSNNSFSSSNSLTIGNGFEEGDELIIVCRENTSNRIFVNLPGAPGIRGIGTYHHCVFDGIKWLISQSPHYNDSLSNLYIGFGTGIRNGVNNVHVGSQIYDYAQKSTALGIAVNVQSESVGIGYEADAPSSKSVALGAESNANAGHSVAIGFRATADNLRSISIGNYSEATSDNSLAIGYTAETNGQENAIALGEYAYSRHPNSLTRRIGNNGSSSDQAHPAMHVRELLWSRSGYGDTTYSMNMISDPGPAAQARNMLTYSGTIQAFKAGCDALSSWEFKFSIARDDLNNTRIVGKTINLIGNDGSGSTVSADITLDQSNNRPLIRVTGNPNETWYWIAEAKVLDIRIA
jgi:hypothetical protein